MGELSIVAALLRMVPEDMDDACKRAICACNYANVLGEAFK